MAFELFADIAPYVLILGGAVAVSWFVEKIAGATLDAERLMMWLLKGISYFGFLVGILLMATAALAWSQSVGWDLGTKTLLLITGLALFLKPIKDFPLQR